MTSWRTLRASLILLLLLAASCGRDESSPPVVSYESVNVTSLPGWDADRQGDALGAFQRSCGVMMKRLGGQGTAAPHESGSLSGAWNKVCAASLTTAASENPKRFFETGFDAYKVKPAQAEGLFTGYYEPLLNGARQPDQRYATPLYEKPSDLISVSLGDFSDDLRGRQLWGRVQDSRLVPYDDRAAIIKGSLQGRARELVWVDDPTDAFFMAIQGSGQIRLPDETRIRVGYAAQNGRPYRAIGRDLVAMGALTSEQVSMQSIRDWLHQHPDQADALMAKNPSYVFFRELGRVDDTLGPLGAQGVPLTPGRSLAVDREEVPYGMPVWIDTMAPFPEGRRPLQRLMIAQDTGGAIHGAVRGDVFWGSGAAAAYIAGQMKEAGQWYLLLPKGLPAPISGGDLTASSAS
ncbi:membrane-bound lytic murein transglycosylase A [Arboricoccus pini]|uniref:peptidoglycan lytic exotransglycosylase n=1 Tax=Arboricoccus pini TaxID=1963835 RepID=A0A212QT36_9PROT|nr:murein transglycosylase A [Arboricoccus pini]SNB62631.1 membrane-bound lytic murein transglycosylase A [Arboricoccus pini]